MPPASAMRVRSADERPEEARSLEHRGSGVDLHRVLKEDPWRSGIRFPTME